MNNANPKKKILVLAVNKILEFAENHPEWRDYLCDIMDFDEWFGLGKKGEWDLNIGIYGGSKFATLYPVVNGQTQTDTWFELIGI